MKKFIKYSCKGKFINTYVAELKRGLNKDFKSVEEFEKWKNKMTNDLCEFNYTLTDKERWTLSSAVNDAVQLTEEEIKNKNQSLKQIKQRSLPTYASRAKPFWTVWA